MSVNDSVALPCICEGNWRLIVHRSEALLGQIFVDRNGMEYHFQGVMHAADDYYYSMVNIAGQRLLTCVLDLAGHGFTLLSEVSQ